MNPRFFSRLTGIAPANLDPEPTPSQTVEIQGKDGNKVTIEGGPLAQGGAPTTTTSAAPAPTTTAAAEPFYVGPLGTFQTAEELRDHTRKLEKNILDKAIADRAAAPAPTAPVDTSPKIGEVIFEDADKAVGMIEERILSTLDRRDAHKDAQQKFWNAFDIENPDLKGLDDIVQSQFKELMASDDYRKLPPEVARKQLAQKSRSIVERAILSRGLTTTEIKSGPAVTVSSGGSSAPRTPQPEPEQNFVEQMKSLQHWR